MTATILVTITQQGEVEAELQEELDEAVEGNIEAGEGHSEETTNPILPTANELFWGAAMFFLLWALMKFVFVPPVAKIMKERNDKVRTDLDAADHAKAQAATALAEYEASLTSARAEASRIIEDARARADAQRRDILATAEAEVAEMRSAAAAEVAEAKQAAMAELRASVSSIAVGAAEAVVSKRLDEAAQLQVIEDYVNRAGQAN